MILPKPYLFLHIPKTAGTTLSEIVRQNTGRHGMAHFWHPPPPYLDQEIRTKEVIFGHFLHGLHRRLGLPCQYVTVLRNPLDRVVSHYYYSRVSPHEPWHHLTRDNSLQEWIHLSSDARNLQVQFLAGRRCEAGRGELELAKKNLERCGLVGLLERFDETLLLMRKYLGFQKIGFRKRKVSRSRPATEALSEEIREEILDANSLDVELYRLAEELFREKLEAAGGRRRAADRQNFELRERAHRRGASPAAAPRSRLIRRSGPDEVMLKVESGKPLRLGIDYEADLYHSAKIAGEGWWEPHNTALLTSLLSPGDRFVDVGAGIGYFTLVAADRVGRGGRVMAFEPERENHRLAERNVKRNGFAKTTRVERLALGHRRERQPLYKAFKNSCEHRLALPHWDAHDRQGTAVEVRSLDEVALGSSALDRVDLVKVDAPGFETRVLLGMQRVLEQNRNRLLVLVDHHPMLLRESDAEDLGLERFWRFLSAEVSRIFLVRREQPQPQDVILQPLDVGDLREHSEALRHLGDRDIRYRGLELDLLLVFSERGGLRRGLPS